MITSFDRLCQAIDGIDGKPVALDAQWDGDTQGWYLYLSLYVQPLDDSAEFVERYLGDVPISRDIEFFRTGTWEGIELAKRLGTQAAEKYDLEFYFPSERPEVDCPKWSQRHLAIQCADCHRLILPNENGYWPKDICGSCDSVRKHNQKIRDNILMDDHVLELLLHGEEIRSKSFTCSFENLAIAPLIREYVQNQRTPGPINSVILQKEDFIRLRIVEQFQERLEQKLRSYKKSTKPDFIPQDKINYGGKDYELDITFQEDHREIMRLIVSLQSFQEAVREDYRYEIYFVENITYRDFEFLRLISEETGTGYLEFETKFGPLLSEDLIRDSLAELEKKQLITRHSDLVKLTKNGKIVIMAHIFF